MPTTEVLAEAFESLADLRQAHLDLLRKARDLGGATAAGLAVEPFLDRAQALGARLDAVADREAAQGILDYWTAALLTASATAQRPPRQAAPRALAEFDAGTVGQAAAATERAVAALGPDGQELARRLMLRLVRLTPDGTFEPVAVRRADLEAVGRPDRVGPVLASLEAAGAVRRTADADGPAYALRYEALARTWPRYADWLDKRARFRDQVRYWEKNARGRGALISGPLLTDALTYHDLSGTEKEYLDQSRQRESRLRRVWQAATVVAVLLMLAAAAGWVRAWNKSRETERALEGEKKAQEELGKQDLSRAKKEVLQSMNGLVQSLARATLAGDNEAERDRAERRWRSIMGRKEELIKDLRAAEERAGELRIQGSPNTELLRIVEKLYGQFPARIDEQTNDPRGQALKPLRLGQEVKAKLGEHGDDVLREELGRLRGAAFNYARSSTASIVERIRQRDYWTASQYIKEFWVLYWGEMGILEGEEVAAAMKRFGDTLGEVDELFRDWSDRKELAEGAPKPFWQQNLKTAKGTKYKDDPEYEKRFRALLQELEVRKRALDTELTREERGTIEQAAPLTAY